MTLFSACIFSLTACNCFFNPTTSCEISD
jgi:hypothetical protein